MRNDHRCPILCETADLQANIAAQREETELPGCEFDRQSHPSAAENQTRSRAEPQENSAGGSCAAKKRAKKKQKNKQQGKNEEQVEKRVEEDTSKKRQQTSTRTTQEFLAKPDFLEEIAIGDNLKLPVHARGMGWKGFDRFISESTLPARFREILELMDVLFPTEEGEETFFDSLWEDSFKKGWGAGYDVREALKALKARDSS